MSFRFPTRSRVVKTLHDCILTLFSLSFGVGLQEILIFKWDFTSLTRTSRPDMRCPRGYIGARDGCIGVVWAMDNARARKAALAEGLRYKASSQTTLTPSGPVPGKFRTCGRHSNHGFFYSSWIRGQLDSPCFPDKSIKLADFGCLQLRFASILNYMLLLYSWHGEMPFVVCAITY